MRINLLQRIFFIFVILGALFSVSSHKAKNIFAGSECPNATCPAGKTLQACNSWCMSGQNAVERWGVCCEPGGVNCDAEGKYDSYACTGGKNCAGGVCEDPATCVPNCLPWNASVDSCGKSINRCPISCNGKSRTYYCVDFSCSWDDNMTVEAERCQGGVWENGGGVGGSSGIVDGKIEYEGVWLPKNCFVSQTDYFTTFDGETPRWSTYTGHTMFGDRIPIAQCLAVTSTPTPTSTPVPPSATFSGSCDPQINDSNQHIFRLSNISGGNGNVDQATLFLSFSSSAPADNQIRTFLGNPTWESGSWFGYFVNRKSNLGQVTQVIFDPTNNSSPIGADGKTWGDLAMYLQTNAGASGSSIPANYQVRVEAGLRLGGVPQLDTAGEVLVPLRQYTCTAPLYPQCLLVEMLDSDQNVIPNPDSVSPGQIVKFRCSSDLPNEVGWYEFRVGKRTGLGLEEFEELDNLGGSNFDVSISYTIQPGEYVAQCRVCSESMTPENCVAWEPVIWPDLPPAEPPELISCDNPATVVVDDSGNEDPSVDVQAISSVNYTNVELRVSTAIGNDIVLRNPIFSDMDNFPDNTWIWNDVPVNISDIDIVHFFVDVNPDQPGQGGEVCGAWTN